MAIFAFFWITCDFSFAFRIQLLFNSFPVGCLSRFAVKAIPAEWSCLFFDHTFSFNGFDLIGLALRTSVFANPFEMVDALKVFFFDMLGHLRLICWNLIIEILGWISSIAYIFDIALIFLACLRITEISFNICNCETIFSFFVIGTDATYAGTK
jgi:hypothetical protein